MRIKHTVNATEDAFDSEMSGVYSGFLVGTSADFLRAKALPKLVRARKTVFIIGPKGCGKTSVARRIAGGYLRLNRSETEELLVERVRRRVWPTDALSLSPLLLDGPEWLWSRPLATKLLVELLELREKQNRQTIVVQDDSDGSIALLYNQERATRGVTLGLRFPKSRKERMRAGYDLAERLSLPRERAFGTAELEPWTYTSVLQYLKRK